jgi:hypothetical protein
MSLEKENKKAASYDDDPNPIISSMYDGYLKRCPVDNDDTSAPAR